METATDLSLLFTLLEEMPEYRELKEKLHSGGSVVAGVVDDVRPFLLAALHQGLKRTLLVVTPRPDSARAMHDSLAAWIAPSSELFLLPEPDVLPYERLPIDPFTGGERLRAFRALQMAREGNGAPIVVASAWASAALTTSYDRFCKTCFPLNKGMKLDLPRMLEEWFRAGYEMEEVVEVPGTVSRRGGIVDVFPPSSPHPFRLELAGNHIESLRQFNPTTQRSLGEMAEAQITPAREMLLPEGDFSWLDLSSLNDEACARFSDDLSQLNDGTWFPGAEFYAPLLETGSLAGYLPPSTLIVWDGVTDIQAAIMELHQEAQEMRREMEEKRELPPNFPLPYLLWDQVDKGVWADFHSLCLERWQEAERLPFAGLPRFGGHWPLLVKDLRRRLREGQRVVLVSHQAARLSELLWEQEIPATPSTLDTPPQAGAVKLLNGLLTSGWRMESPEVALFTDAEIFGFVKERRLTVKRPVRRQPFLSQFRLGDFVVHIEHGVAKFAGTTRMEREGEEKEYLVLEYAQSDRLFVPADQVDRVSRYFGPRGGPPTVSRLGTQEWKRTRERVKKATEEVARELLDLYAARQVSEGVAFSPDTPWQQEMEAAFPYVETSDQAEAAHQVKADMERLQPMDRLVCGDVGYGKTEVAIRAAFKAVMDGRQVAILVPTTVLAQQHYSTFGQRLAPFPTRVEVLSRFRSHQEQSEVLRGLRDGTVDICIGTHRLLQKDVVFKDLGLVIVDEEQRFGVKHKESLKQMRKEVDVLT
ncbi:MAG: CarD family transcriptional regulator, partial [Dehalococcoidia bacterium]|nr:CarD family transcriptional regulator [Dehalococcoidia bacterium]